MEVLMSKYETTVVFDGALPENTIEKERKKIEDLLVANGNLVSVDEWGKKILAYSINKKTTGFYVLFVYEYNGNAGKFIETNFKFNENIIRYLTVIHENAAIVAMKKSETANAAIESIEEREEQ
jgi:small subunit ribosomal protein S6